jgi:Protease inhibitor Inh
LRDEAGAMVRKSIGFCAALLVAVTGAAQAQGTDTAAKTTASPATKSDLATKYAGSWELAVDNRAEACRLLLRAEKSDKGDFFLGMPAACRHAMPWLAKVGRWDLPDATHLTLEEPGGVPVVTLAATSDGFVAAGSRIFTLRRIGGDAAEGSPLDGPAGAAIVPVAHRKAAEPASAAPAPAVHVTAAEIAGRYAVMRDKRDTGCMLTLDDKTRGKAGGDRAQLAPGCRDQGIVIFDPVGWRLVKGELILTARAGHTAKLGAVGEDRWAKDVTDGSKPLGLKKL